MSHPSVILMCPHARPTLTRDAAVAMLEAAGVVVGLAPVLLARRGYYTDCATAPGANDIGVYDDAVFLVSPTAFAGFNANTDPSRELPGIATLALGTWLYQPGIHGLSHPVGPRRYPAFVQAAGVTISRAGEGEETGYFGINIHHGSYGSTSSEGCQTIFPDQWDEFHTLVLRELAAQKWRTIQYVLTQHTI